MTRIAALFAVLTASLFWGQAASACLLNTGSNKCAVAGPPAPPFASRIMQMRNNNWRGEPIRPGTVLPRNKYNILLLADYYGLPAVRDGWVYVEVERNVYRVDFRSFQVLEMVTDQTAANW